MTPKIFPSILPSDDSGSSDDDGEGEEISDSYGDGSTDGDGENTEEKA
jgi:hypothetical protein